MVQIRITACDIDPTPGQVTHTYTITEGDRRVTLDLCAEHGAYLEELLTREADGEPVEIPAQTPQRRVTRPRPEARRNAEPRVLSDGRKRGIHVKSIKEIEAEKKGRKG